MGEGEPGFLNDTGEYEPLKEDPVEILRRGRDRLKNAKTLEDKEIVKEQTKNQVKGNASLPSPEEKE